MQKLITYQHDGQIKVITGLRRSGKSYLLRKLYRDYLLSAGVSEDQIIMIDLEKPTDFRHRDPMELYSYVSDIVEGKAKEFYLFIDEIQLADTVPNPYNPSGKKITFYDALNGFRALSNLDVYVTGSNSKMLSSDILTEFRGRSDEIRMHPLCFSEYYSAVGGEENRAFDDYAYYGGMPFLLSLPTDEAKTNYLKSLFSEVYIKDIVERKKIERADILDQLIDLLSASIGSLTNPSKISNTLVSKQNAKIAPNTIRSYIAHLEDAFLFSESKRYDVRGKAYLNSPNKYYSEDIGLRNARIGFREQEMTHIMENIVYNELIVRGFSVDVGVVYARELNKRGNSVRVMREIDFVATRGGKKVYIQSAYALTEDEKKRSEVKPFSLTGDSFPKIIVRRDVGKRWYDDYGILNINIIDFLLDKSSV